MLNIDRVKRIMRAKHGSQILKFLHPSGGFPKLKPFKPFENPEGFDLEMYNNLATFPKEINWQPNFYMEANEIPTPKLDATDIPLPNSNLSWTPETPLLYQNTPLLLAPKLDMLFETPEGFPEHLKYMSDFNITMRNFMEDLKGNKFTYNPDFLRKTSLQKNFLQKAVGGIGNFVKNNPQLVKNGLNVGYEFLTDYFRKGVYNNKGSLLILDGVQTIGNLVPAAKPFALALEGTNKMLGEHANPYHTDKNLRAKMATSYKDSYQFLDKAEQDANKFYGFLSTGSRQNANKHSRQAQGIELDIRNIRNEYEDLLASANLLAYLRYADLINGTFTNPLAFALHVKLGGKLLDKINLVKSRKFNQVINVDTKQVEKFPHHVDNSSINYKVWNAKAYKEGGVIQSEWVPEIELDWEPIIEIPEFLEGGKLDLQSIYDYYKDYDLAGINLIYDNSARTEGNTIYVNSNESAIHELWHLLSLNKPNEKYKEFYDNLNDDKIVELGGDLEFVKRFENDPGHFYQPPELEARVKAAKYMSNGHDYTEEFFLNLRSTDENKWGDNMRDLLHMFNNKNLVKIFNLKKGGTIKEELETPEIEETNQKNLIPEGALHKNKHHMEHTEGLTLKGIPVIDNDGEQQAEIELNEIIFTLEVTKKLEELYKEGTDEAAIEAGKLLVKEILFNTDDRTGLIAKCLEGGKL